MVFHYFLYYYIILSIRSYSYSVSVSVLYGANIDRDFTEEFNFIEKLFSIHSEIVWDGEGNMNSYKEEENTEELAKYFPEESFKSDLATRYMHSIGKSSVEILESRIGLHIPIVDGVVFPDNSNINAIINGILNSGKKALIYGGGTNVSGCFRIKPGKGVIAINTSKLNNISITGNIISAGSGITGPELEKVANAHGLTCGNFPESFNYSTFGGWIATMENGQESNQYGGIENSVISVKVLTSKGEISDNKVPREAAGLQVKTAVTGSEGKYGIILGATIKGFKLPDKKYFSSYSFKTFEEGIEAIKNMKRYPTVLRLSNETETMIALMSGKNTGMKKIFMDYLGLRGVKNGAMMIMVNNDYQFKEKLIGGIPTTAYPAKMWARDRYSRPALANILWKHGYIPDTLETSCQWDKITELYNNTVESFRAAEREKGFTGIIMAHISHIYHTGACIYFTYIIRSENSLEDLLFVRKTIMNSILKNGGAITDHHGSGTLFSIYKNPEKLKMQNMLNDELFSGWQDGQ